MHSNFEICHALGNANLVRIGLVRIRLVNKIMKFGNELHLSFLIYKLPHAQKKGFTNCIVRVLDF